MSLKADPRKVYGGTGAKEGMVLVAQKGLAKILDLSKKNPSNVFLMSDDNYTKFGPYYVKNGKVAKYTVANPNYDLEKNKVRSLKVPSDVILKFKIVEGAEDAGKAIIPAAIKMRLQKAMDVLDGKKLTYQQKIKVLGKVIDSLGIDKSELNKVTQKIRTKLESVNESKQEVIELKKKVGNNETKFYDILSTVEKKYGKNKYRIWLEKSLKEFGENPKHYDYRTNAAIEEKLFQLAK